MELQWTENRKANELIKYDHCLADTPFGRFLLTWKSWKEFPSYAFDEKPWEGWDEGVFNSVEEAQDWAQLEYSKRIAQPQKLLPIDQAPVGVPVLGVHGDGLVVARKMSNGGWQYRSPEDWLYADPPNGFLELPVVGVKE